MFPTQTPLSHQSMNHGAVLDRVGFTVAGRLHNGNNTHSEKFTAGLVFIINLALSVFAAYLLTCGNWPIGTWLCFVHLCTNLEKKPGEKSQLLQISYLIQSLRKIPVG